MPRRWRSSASASESARRGRTRREAGAGRRPARRPAARRQRPGPVRARSWPSSPACKVVFLTVYDDEQYLYQALRVGRGRVPAEADPRRRAGRLPAAGSATARCSSTRPGRRGSRCPPPGCTAASSGPARTSVSPSGRARCSRCSSAGLSNRAIAAQAGGQRGDGEDPLPRHLPQARRVRPGRARSRWPCARACSIDRRHGAPDGVRRRARGAAAVPGDRHHLGRPGPRTGCCRAWPSW